MFGSTNQTKSCSISHLPGNPRLDSQGMVLPTGTSRRLIVKVGDQVIWRFRYEMDLPSEIGITLEKFTPQHEFFPYWKVVFPDRGVLHCRESDIMVIL